MNFQKIRGTLQMIPRRRLSRLGLSWRTCTVASRVSQFPLWAWSCYKKSCSSQSPHFVRWFPDSRHGPTFLYSVEEHNVQGYSRPLENSDVPSVFFGNAFDLGFVMGQDPPEYLIRGGGQGQTRAASHPLTRQGRQPLCPAWEIWRTIGTASSSEIWECSGGP